MGVVNVTPDSFSDGGSFLSSKKAVDQALRLVDEGADILDIGGESTRPGASPVPPSQELDRVMPVIEALAQRADAALSIDTRKPGVARAAINAGAAIWNDVSALTFDGTSPAVAAELQCELVLMHAQGDPKTMQIKPHYDDVVAEVAAFLRERANAAQAAGVSKNRIMVDPGIGFGKTLPHNLALLAHLDAFTEIAPVLLGVSRKSFIAAIDREENGANPTPDQRLGGSLAAILASRCAAVLRVHDVAATRQAVAVFEAIETVRRSR